MGASSTADNVLITSGYVFMWIHWPALATSSVLSYLMVHTFNVYSLMFKKCGWEDSNLQQCDQHCFAHRYASSFKAGTQDFYRPMYLGLLAADASTNFRHNRVFNLSGPKEEELSFQIVWQLSRILKLFVTKTFCCPALRRSNTTYSCPASASLSAWPLFPSFKFNFVRA